MTAQRYDHYYCLEGEGEIEEGHIFCTIDEGREIKGFLETRLGTKAVAVIVETGGEYHYTTEGDWGLPGTAAERIARDIWSQSGFNVEDEE